MILLNTCRGFFPSFCIHTWPALLTCKCLFLQNPRVDHARAIKEYSGSAADKVSLHVCADHRHLSQVLTTHCCQGSPHLLPISFSPLSFLSFLSSLSSPFFLSFLSPPISSLSSFCPLSSSLSSLSSPSPLSSLSSPSPLSSLSSPSFSPPSLHSSPSLSSLLSSLSSLSFLSSLLPLFPLHLSFFLSLSSH